MSEGSEKDERPKAAEKKEKGLKKKVGDMRLNLHQNGDSVDG